MGEYRFLSNFWPCYISDAMYEKLLYPTLQHAYEAAKVSDPLTKKLIRDCETPGKAKAYHEKNNTPMHPSWNTSKKLEVMEKLLMIKFDGKEPFLTRALLATGDHQLIEGNTWEDTFWGVYEGAGENHLGKLLMKVRKYLNAEKQAIISALAVHSNSRKFTGAALGLSQRGLYQKMIAYEIDSDSQREAVSALKLEQYHAACKLIEVDGLDGIKSAANLVGTEIALVLGIAHVRRNLGSIDTYPAREGIDEDANAILKGAAIL